MALETMIALLNEDRKKNRKYLEKMGTGKLKDTIVEVTVELGETTIDGKTWTSMATDYLALKKEVDDTILQLETMNSSMRDKVEDMFDTVDEAATRVVKIGEIYMKLAKAAKPEPKVEVNYEKIVAALAELSEDMKEKVAEITKQFTSIKPPAATKKPALRVSDDTPVDRTTVKEGVEDMISSIVKYTKSFMSWLSRIDKRIESLDKKVSAF